MKNALLLLGSAFLFMACSSDGGGEQTDSPKAIALATIDSLEGVINQKLTEEKTTPSLEIAMGAVEAYEKYQFEFPEDEQSGEYLFKSAQMYETVLRDPMKAVDAYQKVYDMYPSYENHPMALFHVASLYHDLGDTTNAITNFELFIKNHPDHPFVEDAQGMIKIVRIGMEEFLKQADQNNAEDPS